MFGTTIVDDKIKHHHDETNENCLSGQMGRLPFATTTTEDCESPIRSRRVLNRTEEETQRRFNCGVT